MVYSFNWNPQPKDNAKATEAVAVQYIKARYGVTPAEFARKIIKEQTSQEKTPVTNAINHAPVRKTVVI